ncbi:MAG: hypothetical protein NDF54_07095 [archaeon GB-1867-035]|nr:hypothetical protein [Candidatus Culexmicrobium profundum]
MIKDLREALKIARYFVLYDSYGPYGDFGSFIPLSVEYNEEKDRWIVTCKFKKGKEQYKAKLEINAIDGRVISYKIIEK